MNLADLWGGFLTGSIGGFVSGFLGVTSGGILVPLLILILGRDQHVAQGISLVAQIVPTSLSGARNYARSGHAISLRRLVWLAIGFCAGGAIGAVLATRVSDRALQWCYVGYLLVLLSLLLLRRTDRTRKEAGDGLADDNAPLYWIPLAAIGAAAGCSSGFLGIGGGLAITALLAGMANISQHRAQAISLAVTALPVTLPAALFYVQQGTDLPWLAIVGLVVGLWIGTDVGARLANRISPDRLRMLMALMIAAMAAFMAFKAWR